MRPGVSSLSLAFLIVGLSGGTLLDDRPARPVTERAGYRVLEADFHVHTRMSDGFLSPFDVVIQADRRGLDALAVTEHNGLLAAYLARWFSQQIGGPTVIIGEEVTTRRFHVIGIGLHETVPWNQPLADILADIHAQGGAAIAAHPVGRFWQAFNPVRERIHAAELMHPIAFREDGSAGWRWEELPRFRQEALDDGFEIGAIGSSDYHFFSPLGLCRTLVFARDDSADAIVEAVRTGRTVVYDRDGRAYGPSELLELLDTEPVEVRSSDYNYAGSGWLDRTTRTLGWLGLLGLLVFRPARWRVIGFRSAAGKC